MGSSPSKTKGVHFVRGEPDAPLPPESQSSLTQDANIVDSNHDSAATTTTTRKGGFQKPTFTAPTGRELEALDKVAAKLPQYMDEVTRNRVIQAAEQCQGGKGPMIPCFNHAEFLSQFQSRHHEAVDFFVNTCFRPKDDKSPHGVLVDGTKCFPAACFQLASMRMTGRGGTQFDPAEGYRLYDRACRGGHGGGCHLQARLLLSYPGQMGPGVPYNPPRAAELLESVCYKHNDPVSCFTLASVYLRGERVSSEAVHVSPEEARGLKPIADPPESSGGTPTTSWNNASSSSSPNTLNFNALATLSTPTANTSRRKDPEDERQPLKRNPKKALELLLHACNNLQHGGACHNVAVMYTQGDEGIPPDEVKAKYYKDKTEEMLNTGAGILPF